MFLVYNMTIFFSVCALTCIEKTIPINSKYQVFVKDSVLYGLRTRQRARSASRAPKARGTSALARVRHVFTLVPSDTVAPNSFHWHNTNTWSVAQTSSTGHGIGGKIEQMKKRLFTLFRFGLISRKTHRSVPSTLLLTHVGPFKVEVHSYYSRPSLSEQVTQHNLFNTVTPFLIKFQVQVSLHTLQPATFAGFYSDNRGLWNLFQIMILIK